MELKPKTKKILKFLAIGGAAAAAVNMTGIVQIPIIESIGIITGSVLLKNAIDNGDILKDKADSLVKTFGMVGVGGFAAGIVATVLPATHLLHYGTNMLLVAGIGGAVHEMIKMRSNANKENNNEESHEVGGKYKL